MIPVELLQPLPVYYRHTVGENLLDVMGHMNIHGYMYILLYRYVNRQKKAGGPETARKEVGGVV